MRCGSAMAPSGDSPLQARASGADASRGRGTVPRSKCWRGAFFALRQSVAEDQREHRRLSHKSDRLHVPLGRVNSMAAQADHELVVAYRRWQIEACNHRPSLAELVAHQPLRSLTQISTVSVRLQSATRVTAPPTLSSLRHIQGSARPAPEASTTQTSPSGGPQIERGALPNAA
jgi:hypothetical protein